MADKRHRSSRAEAGTSLNELLVAMAAGLVILALRSRVCPISSSSF